MTRTDRRAVVAWRNAIGLLLARWLALKSDWKSVTLAIAVLGLIVCLELQVPW